MFLDIALGKLELAGVVGRRGLSVYLQDTVDGFLESSDQQAPRVVLEKVFGNDGLKIEGGLS